MPGFATAGRRAAAVLAIVGALAGCGGSLPEGVWRGSLTPETAGRACEPAQAELVMAEGRFQFAPTGGVVGIDGTLEKDGRLHGQRDAPGMDKKPFVQSFDGTLQADGSVTGTFVTPRCKAAVALRRSEGRGFVQDLLRR